MKFQGFKSDYEGNLVYTINNTVTGLEISNIKKLSASRNYIFLKEKKYYNDIV